MKVAISKSLCWTQSSASETIWCVYPRARSSQWKNVKSWFYLDLWLVLFIWYYELQLGQLNWKSLRCHAFDFIDKGARLRTPFSRLFKSFEALQLMAPFCRKGNPRRSIKIEVDSHNRKGNHNKLSKTFCIPNAEKVKRAMARVDAIKICLGFSKLMYLKFVVRQLKIF